jgi:ABC-type uncharacterized transport system involved in gliding motility auxiliary subunit
VRKSFLSISGIVFLGVILLLLNGISDRVFSRFYIDLTEEKLYSLSEGTERILKSLEEPIILRYYFSKTDGARYPAIKLYATRVLDLLKQYERTSKGKLKLEVYDPRPDTEEEEWAQKYGLTPLSLATGDTLFFGLAGINSAGSEDVIPLFDLRREQFLEYDITKLVYSLKVAKQPVVGIVSSLDIEGAPQQSPMPGRPPMPGTPWILVNQLSKFSQVRFLKNDTDNIPADVDVLMVIHPKNFPEQTRYAIDQFVVNGGKLFVAIDPYCGTDQPKSDPNNPMAAMMADRSSNLPKLLSTWGVSLKEKKLVADVNLATKVSTGPGALPQSFVLWLTLNSQGDLRKEVINRDSISTSQLENVMLAWVGALQLTGVKGIAMEPLFRSTTESVLFNDSDVRFGGGNPEELLKKYIRGSESHVLGVKLVGKFKSSFDKKPGSEEVEPTMSVEGGHVSEGTNETSVVVVADVDFLADQYSARSQRFLGAQLITLLNDNLVFAANVVENLTGSNDLISLRSRGRFTRPFTKVQELEAKAQERYKLEEMRLQAKLNQANQRLSQLQNAGGGEEGKKVFNKALLDEIKIFREERKNAQKDLRNVRRRLREDIERLGTLLFLSNTFLVPLLLIIGSSVFYLVRKKRTRSKESKE